MTQNTAKLDQGTLGKRIRMARRQLELSQLEVALHAGISQSQYSLFEHGHAQLGQDVLTRIRDALGMNRLPRKQVNHENK